MTNRIVVAVLATCQFVFAGAVSQAAEPQAPPKAGPVVILDTNGMWRLHQTLQPPVVRTANGLKPLLLKAAWVDRSTSPPPADWMKTSFDDHLWLRGPARLVNPTPYVARLCLRGKFDVTDPSKVQALKLTIQYQGGVVVYVNGKEVGRVDVVSDKLAKDYPTEAFLDKDGGLLRFEAANRTLRPDDPRIKMIRRSLTDLAIPSRLLRPGVNVIGIEILRAPYPYVVEEKKNPKKNYWNFAWDTCRINRVQLTAPGAAGLVPNAFRPSGFQVWNSNALACDYDLDFGDPTEKLFPVEIVGARNGSFSGKVVVGCSRSIRGLRAKPDDLKTPGGTIPAARVQVRYGFAWGRDEIVVYYGVNPYPAKPVLLGGLTDRPPEEIPVGVIHPGRRKPTGPAPVAGAVAPVWVTVHVPKDAAPGTYRGKVTLSADGEKPVAVPVVLHVADWTLPDVEDRRTCVEILQSPDTLAMEYKVPLWSQRHWDLIAQSFRLMSDSGSRIVYVPLIAETNFGNEQSMVRWIKKGPNKYNYDFTVMEKYLDAAEKNLGKPRIVVANVWDVYMLEKDRGAPGSLDARWQAERERGHRKLVYGQGPIVTTRDPASNKAENVILPRYTEPGSEAMWNSLFEQLRQRLAKRGLDKALMLGLMTDVWPTKEEVGFMAKVAPGAPWAIHSHGGGGPMVYNLAKVGYRIRVWGIKHAVDRSLMGWKQSTLLNRYWRQRTFNAYPTAMWRQLSEFAVTGNQRGTGRLGGDFWKVLRDKKGQRVGRIYARYPQSNWRNLDIYVSLLSPGLEGPGLTHHYVHFVEGVQESEARISIERALSNPALKAKLPPGLADRCKATLDERLRDMKLCFSGLTNRLNGNPSAIGSTCGPGTASHYWFLASGWEGREQTLFALAGEVARALGEN